MIDGTGLAARTAGVPLQPTAPKQGSLDSFIQCIGEANEGLFRLVGRLGKLADDINGPIPLPQDPKEVSAKVPPAGKIAAIGRKLARYNAMLCRLEDIVKELEKL